MIKVNADSSNTFQNGFLFLLPYAIFLISAIDALFTNRILDNQTELLTTSVQRNPINMWLVRGVSVFVLVASFNSLLVSKKLHRNFLGSHTTLAFCFGLFWLGSRGLNMAFAAQPYFGHEYFYSLIIGLGVLALTSEDAKKFVLVFRNASFLFLVGSFLILLIKPSLVLEQSYKQGYLGGLPRFAGLTSHAVMVAQVALINLLLLFTYPFHNRFLNRMAIVVGLLAFFLAQSKTAWIAGFLAALIMSYYYWQQCSLKSKKNIFGLSLLTVVFLIIGTLGFVYLLLVMSAVLDSIILAFESSQLASLTGRDVIWQYALNKWFENPLFGFGQQLFSIENRLLVKMSFATSAHNQVLDLLAKSGLIGLLGFLPYLVVISLKVFRADLFYKRVAVSFFITILIRSISDTPFNLNGYGIDLLIQVTLLAIIVSSSSDDTLKSQLRK